MPVCQNDLGNVLHKLVLASAHLSVSYRSSKGRVDVYRCVVDGKEEFVPVKRPRYEGASPFLAGIKNKS